MEKVYSDRQRELLRRWQEGKLKRLNILEGSVRSGKTWISLVVWAFWVATMPREGSYLMAAKTLVSLKRNVLELLVSLVGERNFSYSLTKKEGRLFGRQVFFEGAGDARAEGKIRGMTLTGAYCDEVSLFGEDFFVMLLSRLSAPGAKLFATTNPDSPNHWLKKHYLDRAEGLDLMAMQFLLEDNVFLSHEYIDSLKNEYAGVFYERYILGRWVNAEGLVYPMFSERRHVVPPYGAKGRYYISVDYGTVNPCSMGLWCVGGGKAVRVDEYYYDSRARQKQKTDEEYYEALEGLAAGRAVQYVVVDPSAASFIETIRRHGQFHVKKAQNSVCDGIRTVATLLGAGKLEFFDTCRGAIREFGLYCWDEGAGEDRVIKENDHAMDEIRYFCSTVLRREFKWDVWK